MSTEDDDGEKMPLLQHVGPGDREGDGRTVEAIDRSGSERGMQCPPEEVGARTRFMTTPVPRLVPGTVNMALEELKRREGFVRLH